MMRKKLLAGLLAALMMFTTAAALFGCADEKPSGINSAVPSDIDTIEADPLAGLDFEDRKFRILTSTNAATGVGNSNYLIEGPEEETGDVVNDAAFVRNRNVEERLNIEFEFTQLNLNYDSVKSHILRLIASVDDAYELLINDLFPMAELSIEGSFTNIYDAPYINLDEDYWYYDYMADLTIGNERMYLMAGDYFMDVIRSAHALFFNKNLMVNLYGEADSIYEIILDGAWTLDILNNYVADSYDDLNGNSRVDENDQFGFVIMEVWGPSIPFTMCGDLSFIERDADGIPSLALNNERTLRHVDKLIELFYNIGMNYNIPLERVLPKFESGSSLFLGYHRLGSLEDLRGMEQDIGVVPYPKLDEFQEYVTSSHDTTEIGVIPITASDLEFIGAVLEALNRETKSVVLPAYYETALKVKYIRDDVSAQMIDIIHDNFKNTFALAYNYALNSILLSTVSDQIVKGSNTFTSNYISKERAASNQLEQMIETFIFGE